MSNKYFCYFSGIILSISLTSPMQAFANEWPKNTIDLIVPSAKNSAPDLISRILTEKLEKDLGWNFNVKNIPGKGGVIGSDLVAKAAPDGYTLVFGNIGSHSMSSSIYKSMPYVPLRDFHFVGMVAKTATVLSVSKKFPAKSFPEFITYLKEQGSNATFASGGIGSSSHLAGEFLNQLTETKATHVPYDSVPNALADVSKMKVSFMLSNLPPALEYFNKGENHPLAVAGSSRHPMLPNVPTTAESGYPKLIVDVWFGIFSPKGIPKDVATKISKAIENCLKDKEFIEKLEKHGFQPFFLSPEEAEGYVRGENVKWHRVAKQSGAYID